MTGIKLNITRVRKDHVMDGALQVRAIPCLHINYMIIMQTHFFHRSNACARTFVVRGLDFVVIVFVIRKLIQ